jgi:hypothetical protein
MRQPRLRVMLVIGALALVAPVSSASGASPSSPRAESHYEIWCTTSTGDTYLAKRVDARAIQLDKNPGGKDTATEHFNENNPYGEHCVELGPFTP